MNFHQVGNLGEIDGFTTSSVVFRYNEDEMGQPWGVIPRIAKTLWNFGEDTSDEPGKSQFRIRPRRRIKPQ